MTQEQIHGIEQSSVAEQTPAVQKQTNQFSSTDVDINGTPINLMTASIIIHSISSLLAQKDMNVPVTEFLRTLHNSASPENFLPKMMIPALWGSNGKITNNAWGLLKAPVRQEDDGIHFDPVKIKL